MGTILGIYLGTVITSWAGFILYEKVSDARLDREGYIDKSESSIPEMIKDFIEIGIFLAIPIIKIVLASFALFSKARDQDYEEYKKEGIARGTIVKKDDAIIEAEKEIRLKKDLLKRKNQALLNKIDTEKKAYSEMTADEKLIYLEREKAYLLSLKEKPQTEEKSYNDRGAYRK